MGVIGLAKFIEEAVHRAAADHSKLKVSSSDHQIDLTELALLVNKCCHIDTHSNHSNAADAAKACTRSSPPSLTILVDTLGIIFRLIELDQQAGVLPASFVVDADFTYIDGKVRWFANLFRAHGIHLRWYLDSPELSGFKDDEARARLSKRVEKLVKLCERINAAYQQSTTTTTTTIHSIEQSSSSSMPAETGAASSATRAKDSAAQPPFEAELFPSCISSMIRASLRSIGADMHICIGEADAELATHAADEYLSDEILANMKDGSQPSKVDRNRMVYAILGRDSDFVITHNIRYISFDDLELDAPSHSMPRVHFRGVTRADVNLAASEDSTDDSDADSDEEETKALDELILDELDEVSQDSPELINAGAASEFLLSPPPASVRKIICRYVYSVPKVCELLKLTPNRLSELAFLIGNDWSKRIALVLEISRVYEANWNSKGEWSSKSSMESMMDRAYLLLSNPLEKVPIAIKPLSLQERIRVWVQFLQRVDLMLGVDRRLETIEPLTQILAMKDKAATAAEMILPTAQPGAPTHRNFQEILFHSRQSYERPHETKFELSSLMPSVKPGVTVPFHLKPSILPELLDAIRKERLPIDSLHAVHTGRITESVYIENTESLESSLVGLSDAFRSQDTDRPIYRLPSVATMCHPLKFAMLMLCNLNGIEVIQREDLSIVTREYPFTDRLRGFQTMLRGLAKELKKQNSKFATKDQEQMRFQLMRSVSASHKKDLLDALFVDMIRESCPHLQSGRSLPPIEWFHLNDVDIADHFTVLIGRYLLGSTLFSCFTPKPSLQILSNQLEAWVAAFMLTTILVRSARQSRSEDDLANAKMLLVTKSPVIHRLDVISTSTALQVMHHQIERLLVSLDLDTQSGDGISTPLLVDVFYGLLFAWLLELQTTTNGSVDQLFSAAETAFLNNNARLEWSTAQGTQTIDSSQLFNENNRSRFVRALNGILANWSGEGFSKFVLDSSKLHVPPTETSSSTSNSTTDSSSDPTDDKSSLTDDELRELEFRGSHQFSPYRSLKRLPIDKKAAKVVESISTSPFAIIQGATGSGKSSRIPGLLLRHWHSHEEVTKRQRLKVRYQQLIRSGKLPPSLQTQPLIIVTQPRRLAAITLCKRVADELGCQVGDECGYAVGQDKRYGPKTQILFVTTGWLCVRLTHKPTFLRDRCSHLLIDEIHERSADSDILSVMLKKLMAYQVDIDADRGLEWPGTYCPRLVLMSATFSADQFVDYFAPIWNQLPEFERLGKSIKVPCIEISVNAFPVTTFFVEDILKAPILVENAALIKSVYPLPITDQQLTKHATGGAGALMRKSDTLDTFVAWIVGALSICHRDDRDANTILVFMPGVSEIENCAATITSEYQRLYKSAEILAFRNAAHQSKLRLQPYENVETVILHSLVDDQMQVFSKHEAGKTRVILATNIAESSVTIPNCRYVIDFGTRKECVYNDLFQCDQIRKTLISRASAKQRSGRTGRICPGTVFRLYSEQLHNGDPGMDAYDVPELLRVSLASVILALKARNVTDYHGWEHSAEDDELITRSGLDDVRALLLHCIQPPSVESIDIAFKELLQETAILLPPMAQVRSKAHAFVDQKQRDNPGISIKQSNKLYRKAVLEEAFRMSHVSSFGRFCSAMPTFSFPLCRLVELGIRFGGRCLNATVVIACALSGQDVFLLPSPLIITSTVRFAQVVAASTLGRIEADHGQLSEPIAILHVVDEFARFLNSKKRTFQERRAWADQRGLHLVRLMGLLRTITEVARRLAVVVGQPSLRESLLKLVAFCSFSKHMSQAIAEDSFTPDMVVDEDAETSMALFSKHEGADDRARKDLHHLGIAEPPVATTTSSKEKDDDSLSWRQKTASIDSLLLQLDSFLNLQLKFLLAIALRGHLLIAKVKPDPLEASELPNASSPWNCVEFTVPSELENSKDLAKFSEFDCIQPSILSMNIDKRKAKVSFRSRPPTARTGLDLYSASAKTSGWRSVLAMPAHPSQTVLVRTFNRNQLQLTPKHSLGKPMPLQCQTPKLAGNELKFHRIRDNLSVKIGGNSLADQLRVYKLKASRCSYSDTVSGIDPESAAFESQLEKDQPDPTVTVFAVAASSKLISSQRLLCERVTTLPTGLSHRLSSLFIAIAFAGKTTLSSDQRSLISIMSTQSLTSTHANERQEGAAEEEEEEEEANAMEEADGIIAVNSFKQMKVPLSPPLPVSMSKAIRTFRESLAMPLDVSQCIAPPTIEWQGASGSELSQRKISLTEAFRELVNELLPKQMRSAPRVERYRPVQVRTSYSEVSKKPRQEVSSSVPPPRSFANSNPFATLNSDTDHLEGSTSEQTHSTSQEPIDSTPTVTSLSRYSIPATASISSSELACTIPSAASSISASNLTSVNTPASSSSTAAVELPLASTEHRIQTLSDEPTKEVVYCDVCQKDVKKLYFVHHIAAKKHLKRVKDAQLLVSASRTAWDDSLPPEDQPSSAGMKKTLRCSTCNFECKNQELLSQHLNGTKHKQLTAQLTKDEAVARKAEAVSIPHLVNEPAALEAVKEQFSVSEWRSERDVHEKCRGITGIVQVEDFRNWIDKYPEVFLTEICGTGRVIKLLSGKLPTTGTGAPKTAAQLQSIGKTTSDSSASSVAVVVAVPSQTSAPKKEFLSHAKGNPVDASASILPSACPSNSSPVKIPSSSVASTNCSISSSSTAIVDTVEPPSASTPRHFKIPPYKPVPPYTLLCIRDPPVELTDPEQLAKWKMSVGITTKRFVKALNPEQKRIYRAELKAYRMSQKNLSKSDTVSDSSPSTSVLTSAVVPNIAASSPNSRFEGQVSVTSVEMNGLDVSPPERDIQKEKDDCTVLPESTIVTSAINLPHTSLKLSHEGVESDSKDGDLSNSTLHNATHTEVQPSSKTTALEPAATVVHLSTRPSSPMSREAEQKKEDTKLQLKCELCEIQFPNSAIERAHLDGKRHKKKLAARPASTPQATAVKSLKPPMVMSQSCSSSLPTTAQLSASATAYASLLATVASKSSKAIELKPTIATAKSSVATSSSKAVSENISSAVTRPNVFQCVICDVKFTGPQPQEIHMKSEKHAKMVASQRNVQAVASSKTKPLAPASAITVKPIAVASSSPKVTKSATQVPAVKSGGHIKLRCDVCNVIFSGPEPQKDHMNSKKHKLATAASVPSAAKDDKAISASTVSQASTVGKTIEVTAKSSAVSSLTTTTVKSLSPDSAGQPNINNGEILKVILSQFSATMGRNEREAYEQCRQATGIATIEEFRSKWIDKNPHLFVVGKGRNITLSKTADQRIASADGLFSKIQLLRHIVGLFHGSQHRTEKKVYAAIGPHITRFKDQEHFHRFIQSFPKLFTVSNNKERHISLIPNYKQHLAEVEAAIEENRGSGSASSITGELKATNATQKTSTSTPLNNSVSQAAATQKPNVAVTPNIAPTTPKLAPKPEPTRSNNSVGAASSISENERSKSEIRIEQSALNSRAADSDGSTSSSTPMSHKVANVQLLMEIVGLFSTLSWTSESKAYNAALETVTVGMKLSFKTHMHDQKSFHHFLQNRSNIFMFERINDEMMVRLAPNFSQHLILEYSNYGKEIPSSAVFTSSKAASDIKTGTVPEPASSGSTETDHSDAENDDCDSSPHEQLPTSCSIQ